MDHSKSQKKPEKYRLDGLGRVRICMFTSPANQAPVPTDPVLYERIRQRLITERDAKNNIDRLNDITLMTEGSEYQQELQPPKPEKYRLDDQGRVRLCTFTSPHDQAPVPTCPIEYERVRQRLIREREVKNYLAGMTNINSTARHLNGFTNHLETSSPTEVIDEQTRKNRIPLTRVFEEQGSSQQ
ncbi:unnamed protein product [Caenorhabditis nigoni]|nr:hypothetical protein B9Z55_022729 [Caenorhabditis nigoni]